MTGFLKYFFFFFLLRVTVIRGEKILFWLSMTIIDGKNLLYIVNYHWLYYQSLLTSLIIIGLETR